MSLKSNDQELSKPLEAVYHSIVQVLETARASAYRAVNSAMVEAYWQIGRIIIEEEQQGKSRAEYRAGLIPALAKRLTAKFGKGFTENNLWYMRQFYQTFPILHALRGELSWTHYRLLLKVENEEARSFYLQETVRSNWSTRELERQVNSLFYERLLLSRDKEKALELAAEGQVARTAQDIIKDPYVLEFLGVRENQIVQEKDLEQGLMNRLQEFLLELGKGFAFVARQRRITIDGDHFYVDLVFYNYLLKCFVLIDLKIGKLTHQDIGQMDFYTRYFEQEESKRVTIQLSASFSVPIRLMRWSGIRCWRTARIYLPASINCICRPKRNWRENCAKNGSRLSKNDNSTLCRIVMRNGHNIERRQNGGDNYETS